MSRTTLALLACLSVLLVACVPIPPTTLPPADADAEDTGMIAGLAAVDSVEVQVLVGESPALLVIARGSFPDGCTAIGETAWRQDGDTFIVTITTVRPADEMCTQALVPYEETVIIEPQVTLAPGTYQVTVNGTTTDITL